MLNLLCGVLNAFPESFLGSKFLHSFASPLVREGDFLKEAAHASHTGVEHLGHVSAALFIPLQAQTCVVFTSKWPTVARQATV